MSLPNSRLKNKASASNSVEPSRLRTSLSNRCQLIRHATQVREKHTRQTTVGDSRRGKHDTSRRKAQQSEELHFELVVRADKTVFQIDANRVDASHQES